MISFMVLCGPRSGSTWLSNWLTTDTSLCLHDPILEYSPEELDALTLGDRRVGICCTGLSLLPDWVNSHPCQRKLVVRRSWAAINSSLESIGLSAMEARRCARQLDAIKAKNVAFDDLFEPVFARPIWEHLMDTPFDAPRHKELLKMRIEPYFSKVPVVPGRARDFRERIVNALRGEAA